MLRSPLNLHMQQKTKVAMNTKKAQMKIWCVNNVKEMKVVQTNMLNVTSAPSGTINITKHLKVSFEYFLLQINPF